VIMIGSKTHTLNAILSLDGEKASRERAKAFAPDQGSVSQTRTRSIRGQGELLMHLNDRGIPSPLPALKRLAGNEGAIVRPGSSMPVEIPTTGVHNRKREAMHVPDEEDNTDFNEESQFSASEEETEETSENTHLTSISNIGKSDYSGDSNYYPSHSGMSQVPSREGSLSKDLPGGNHPNSGFSGNGPQGRDPLLLVSCRRATLKAETPCSCRRATLKAETPCSCRRATLKAETPCSCRRATLKAETLQTVVLQEEALQALQAVTLQMVLQAMDLQEEIILQKRRKMTRKIGIQTQRQTKRTT
jgi:hypothetical protein